MEGGFKPETVWSPNRKAIEARQFQEAEANISRGVELINATINSMKASEAVSHATLNNIYNFHNIINNTATLCQKELDQEQKNIPGYYKFTQILTQLADAIQHFDDVLMATTDLKKESIQELYNKIIGPIQKELDESIQAHGSDKDGSKSGALVEAA